MDCWSILGIEATENKRDIKRAYAGLLKQTHPEDDPEAFQALNQAYQEALQLSQSIIADDTDFEQIAVQETKPDANKSDVIDSDVTNHVTSRHGEHGDDNVNTSTDATPSAQTTELSEEDTQQYAFNESIFAFIENIQKILKDTDARADKNTWEKLLSQYELDSFEFRERSSFAVFSAFVEHFKSDNVSLEGGFVPQSVLANIADIYAWQDYELALSDYFSSQEMNHVLSYAFDNPLSYNHPVHDQKQSSTAKIFMWNIAILLIIFAIFWAYEQVTSKENIEQTAPIAEVTFDERLLACNDLRNAEKTEAFLTCEALAKDGVLDAQKRMVWAYSRAGEHQNWVAMYNWLQPIKQVDRNASLLSFIVMKLIGENEDVKRAGELGIQRLVNRNDPLANVTLASIYGLEQNLLDKSSNILWLLERAHENSLTAITSMSMATLYANGFETQVNIEKGKAALLEGASRNFPFTTNNVAWFLSTVDENPFTDTKVAIALAEQVVNDPLYANTHTFIDTLAATYAADGQFVLAAQTQQRAIDKIQDIDTSDTRKAALTKDFSKRLVMYQNEEAYVESSLYTDKNTFFTALKDDIIAQLLNSFYTISKRPEPAVITESIDNE